MGLELGKFRRSLALTAPSARYWVAYSGGLDSHVLLHLCSRVLVADPGAGEFHAVHVHHGLHPDADTWTEHCRGVCASLCLPLRILRVDARPKRGESPEEAARKARYQALSGLIGAGDVLLTAQHQDDQAETLLLQLLRGAGLAGLAAMPACTAFGSGFLFRPLLEHARSELRAYAEEHGLSWIEDSSNIELAYDRNFIRHRVLPLLRQRWPAAGKTLSRSASHCAEAKKRLDRLAYDLYHSTLNPDGLTLSIQRLSQFDETDRRWVLRQWLSERGYRMPSKRIVGRIAGEVLAAARDKMPVVTWPEGEVRRWRNALYLLAPARPFDPQIKLDWDGKTPLILPHGNGVLKPEPTDLGGIDRTAWEQARIRVCYRRGGETCRLPGRAGSHELKKLFQEAGIPPWERSRLPLVYLDDRLAAVADRWVCEPFAAPAGRDATRLQWLRGLWPVQV